MTTPVFISAPITADSSGNISNIGVGAATGGRVVLLILRVSGTPPTTATIGGVTAVVTKVSSGGNPDVCFVAAIVPTGTTASLATNGSGFTLDGVYTLPSGTTTTPSSSNSSTGSSPLNLSLTPSAGDAATVIALGPFATTNAFTAGVTSDSGPLSDVTNFEALNVGSAGGLSAGSFTATATDTGNPIVLYGATWNNVPVDITGTSAIPATSTAANFAGTAVETPAWSLVGISEGAINASGNYTLTEPAGCQLNDILVVDFAIRSTVIYTNADWIFPQSDSGGNTTNATTASDTSFESGYCIRGSSAPSLVFLRTSGSRALGTIRAYRSNRTGTPVFDTSAKFGQTVASTTITLSGGITTAQDDELLTTGVMLARGAASNNASNMDAVSGITTGSGAKDTTTPPTPGTWIERSDRGNTTSPTVGLACYDGIMGTAGSTGDLSATAASSALNGMIVMAFKHPSAVGGGSLSLAATEAPDVAAFTVGLADKFALSTTEAADVAAFATGFGTSISFAVTEAADTAVFSAAVSDQFALAVTEAADTAVFSAAVSDQFAVSTTEAPDTAAFTTSYGTSISFAVTEAPDIAAFSASLSDQFALATTEAPDVAAFSASVADQFALAATESPDVASFSTTVADQFALATTEATDVAAFTASFGNIVSLALAATESQDTAAFTAAFSDQLSFAVSEAADVAAFTVDFSGVATAILAATEAPDIAAFTGSVVNPVTINADQQYTGSFSGWEGRRSKRERLLADEEERERKKKKREFKAAVEKVIRPEPKPDVAKVVAPQAPQKPIPASVPVTDSRVEIAELQVVAAKAKVIAAEITAKGNLAETKAKVAAAEAAERARAVDAERRRKQRAYDDALAVVLLTSM